MDMFDKLIAREGGSKVVTIPGDDGGTTKYGISSRAYPHLDIPNLTYDMARAIYVRDYYEKPGVHQLPPQFQPFVLDFCVHSGVQLGVKYLQKILNVQQDGIIGPATLQAVASFPLSQLIVAYQRERAIFLCKQIISKPAKIKFLVGWISRVFAMFGE